MSLDANCHGQRQMPGSKNSAATWVESNPVAFRQRYTLHRTGRKQTISYRVKDVSGRVCQEVG